MSGSLRRNFFRGKNREAWWNNKNELAKWLAVYDQKQSKWDRDTEHSLGLRLRKTKSLTKADLTTMVHWKFQRLPGRLKQNLARLANLPDNQVSMTFSEAMNASDEISRIRKLDTLPSVGPAMISVILTFYNPDQYGIIDIHVWRELFGPEPSGLFQGPQFLVKFLSQIRAIAKIHNLGARAVEKALFQRNYDEPLRMA